MKVTLKNLTKKFNETIAVDDLSAEFASGELTALLGPSGCGKSTTLNMLSGILPVTSGQIFFDDKEVTNLPPEKRGIGLVFQNYALYPHMTVLQNICFPLKMQKVAKKERIAKAKEYAKLVHIDDLLNRKPKELSGGQQQRVAIARALIKKPQLLLLDEPLSNLDAKLRVEMREEIRRIQKEAGVTAIFVTHDQEEASSIADHIMILNKGVMQQFGTVRNMYDDPQKFFVADFLGAPAINRLHGVKVKEGFLVDGAKEPLKFNNKLSVDQRGILAVRAESFKEDPDETLFTAKVLECYQAGKDFLVKMEYAGVKMRMYVNWGSTLKNGDEVKVGIKDYGVFMFDEVSGERVYEK